MKKEFWNKAIEKGTFIYWLQVSEDTHLGVHHLLRRFKTDSERYGIEANEKVFYCELSKIVGEKKRSEFPQTISRLSVCHRKSGLCYRDRLLLTAYSLLPTVYCLLPTDHCLLITVPRNDQSFFRPDSGILPCSPPSCRSAPVRCPTSLRSVRRPAGNRRL